MDSPLISVVIPVFNGAAFLAETLANVFTQDHRPLEVVVVDDGSTDDSLAIAQSWGPALRTLHQANAGPSAARNRGIEAAEGPYVAFLDADDLWPADRLGRHLRLLEERSDLDFVLGHVEVRFLASAGEGARRFGGADERLAMFLFGAGLFRRSLFARAGLLSEDLQDSEDFDWFMRAREAGASWLLEDEVALFYRRHGGNLTERLSTRKSHIFRILARAAARRRARGDSGSVGQDRFSDRRKTLHSGGSEKTG